MPQDQYEIVELDSEPGIQRLEEESYQAIDNEEVPRALAAILESTNLAEKFGDEEVFTQVTDMIEDAKASMKPYLDKYEKALKLARMQPDTEDKTFPFAGASKVMMPYVMQAALDFWARTYPVIAERKNIAMAEIFGASDDGIKKRAERVAAMVNYDLRKGIKSWRETQSKALLSLPTVGMYYKKTWYDAQSGTRKSQLLYADDLICDHSKSSFDDCPSKSYEYKLSKSQIVGYIRQGAFVNFDYKEDDETVTELDFIESHCLLDLDQDGVSEPYLVTLCKSAECVVSIERLFEIDDVHVNEQNQVVRIDGESMFTVTTYIPDPAGSFLGMGWGILLSDVFETINTSVRQLIDAGTLQNISANSGFISIGQGGPRSRSRKGSFQLKMGQFTGIEGDNISQKVWQPSFGGPSPTLFQLLEFLKNDASALISTQNVEANPGEAAELYLARLQQGLKLPTAIMVNVYNGITKELQRLHYLYANYLTDEEYRNVLNDQGATVEADFELRTLDICLTSDPTQGSEEERIHKAKIVLDEAKMTPVHDLRKAYSDYYSAIGVTDVDAILPPPQPGQPDPLQVMQAQSMQTMSEAEMLKGQADNINAMAKLMEARIKMIKLLPEIEEIESKTLKNLSDVDKNQHKSMLETLQTEMDTARGMIQDATKVFETEQRSSAQVAKSPGSAGDEGGSQ